MQDAATADRPFFATFNFINFHHAKGLAGSGGIGLLDAKSRDRFHYPLNVTVALNQSDHSANIVIERQAKYCSLANATRLGGTFLDTLSGMVAEIEAAAMRRAH